MQWGPFAKGSRSWVALKRREPSLRAARLHPRDGKWGAFFLTFDVWEIFERANPSHRLKTTTASPDIASPPAIDGANLIHSSYPVICQPKHTHLTKKTRTFLEPLWLPYAFTLGHLTFTPNPAPPGPPTATMGKRTKQYKKLMRSFEFLGFRQPYQVLMTSDVLLDTLKIDLVTLTEKVLSTKSLKPMITQCCIVRTTPM